MVKNCLFGSYLNGHPIIFIFKYGSLNCPDDLVLPHIFDLVSSLFHPGSYIFQDLFLHSIPQQQWIPLASLCQIFYASYLVYMVHI